MGYDLKRFVGEIDEDFQCSICSMVFENPVETPCDHAFCNECITTWLSKDAVCPIDRTPLSLSELERPRRVFRNLLAKLNIKCDYMLKGCEVTVQLEHLEKHVVNCKYNPDSEIICDKGCHGKIYRRELPTHNCLEYLSYLVSLKDVEITNLTSALNDQKDRRRKLVSELQLAVISRDEHITQLKNEIQRWRLQSPIEYTKKWKTSTNLYFDEKFNVFKNIGSDDHKCDIGHAQYDYHLNSSLTVQVVSRSSFFYFGLANKIDPALFRVSSLQYLVGYGNIHRYDHTKWDSGDIMECRIEYLQYLDGSGTVQMVVRFSKNGKLLKEQSIHERTGPVFPTISLSGVGTEVRVITK